MANEPATVDVLLGTYNGGAYLAEQLASLERQTFRGWRLIARDDGSSDDTRAILGAFRARHGASVQLIEDADARLGPVRNYGRLLERSKAEFGMFCDQDDVWRPGKIATLLALARAQEERDEPLLVHSDLAIVDRELRPIAPSLWRYQYIRPERCQWPQLLVHNVVTGCAALFNAPLRQAALPISGDAVMHDWWLALVAAMTCRIRWTDEPTGEYRQHGRNDTGAKRWSAAHIGRQLVRFADRREFRRRIFDYQRQAAALAEMASPRVSAATRAGLRQFAVIDTMPYPQRVRFLLRHGVGKPGLLRNLAFFASV
jgi:hypothetical protein